MSANDNLGQPANTNQHAENPHANGPSDIDALAAKINAMQPSAQQSENAKQLSAAMNPAAMRASRIAFELVLASLFGCAVGWWLDKQLHTSPAFILILSFLGFAAGVWSAWKAMQNYENTVGTNKS